MYGLVNSALAVGHVRAQVIRAGRAFPFAHGVA
jgi:hypothetical protein